MFRFSILLRLFWISVGLSLCSSLLSTPYAKCQASITPVTGFHGDDDPFEKQGTLKVISAAAPITGLSGARATVEVECDEPSDLMAAASSLFGMPLGPSLGFKIGITGANLDIVTTSSVHTTPNLFGPPSRYSTEDRVVDLKLRFDAEDKIEPGPKATDSHHIEFSYYAPEHADEAQRLLMGFSANGQKVALSLNLHEKPLKNVISQCHALKVEQARAREEAQKARILKEAATHLGHPDGMPCTAVARQDIALKYWNKNSTDIVALDDSEARIKTGATLNTLQPNKNTIPSDQTMVVVLRSKDDQNFPRYVIGFAPTSALDMKCDERMVAAEAKAAEEKKEADLAAKEKPVKAMIAYLGLGPVPSGAKSDFAIYVKTKAAVHGYMYDNGYSSGVQVQRGQPSGRIDPAIESTVVESAFKDKGVVGTETTCSLVGPYVGNAEILFGKKYVFAYCPFFPQGAFLPVDALDYSTKAAWNDRKPGTTATDGPPAAANIPLFSAQPIRSGPPTNDVQTKGAWTDPQTKLIWTSRDNGADVDWPHAQQYCQSLQAGGLGGWRLPSLEELKGLYDKSSSQTTPPSQTLVVHMGGRFGKVPAGTVWTVHIRGGIHLDAPTVWTNHRDSFSNIQIANNFSFDDGKDRDTQPDSSGLMRCLCVHGPS
jgi:hypothetical protein